MKFPGRWLMAAMALLASGVQAAPDAVSTRELRLIQPEDIMGLTDAHDAEISPDGRYILYVTQPTISTQRPSRSAIWIIASDGKSPARRLTVANGLDDSPQWSPDGRSIVFLSNRPNTSVRGLAAFDQRPAYPEADQSGVRDLAAGTTPSRQLWLISASGGEARPLTAGGRDIRNYHWSPDGRSIAFLAPDPLPASVRADRGAKRDWVEVDAPQDLTRLWILNVATRTVRRIAVDKRDVTDLTWSPDGTRLALRAAVTTGLNDYFYHSELLVVNATSGAVERSLFKGVYSTGSWSPDGRRLAFIAPEEDAIGIRGFVVDVANGALQQLGATLDGTLKRLEWTRDGKTLLARTTEHTRSVISKVDVPSGRFRRLVAFDGQIRDLSVADDGSIAFAGSQPDKPADIWMLRYGKLVRVTDINPQIREWRLGKVEEVRWTSSRDGRPIYGVLVTPSDAMAGKPVKTVVQGHGGPEGIWLSGWQGSWADWGQMLASHGYAVLLPNPRGSDGQGTTFARGVINGWGAEDYQDVVDGVDMLVARGITDPARVGIGGWSYGGYISAYAITHGTTFKTAIVGAGPTDLLGETLATDTPDFILGYYPSSLGKSSRIDELSPVRAVDRANGPVLVLQGQEDRRVPVTLGLSFYRGLRLLGKDATLVTYPREPHWFFEPEHQLDIQRRVLAWYDRHL